MGAGETMFCFTDIVGSTRLLRSVGEARYMDLLERHRAIIRAALADAGGIEVQAEGDGFFLAFEDPESGVRFAAAAQQQLSADEELAPVKVRFGLHSGPAHRRPSGDFVALAVHRAARVADVSHGAQVVLSADAAATGAAPPGFTYRSLGGHLLRDFDGPVNLMQLCGPGLPDGFPPPRAARALHGLPLPRTSMVGRADFLASLVRDVGEGPLVSVVGPSGVGKTRVSLEAAAELAPAFREGVHFVDLSAVAEPEQVVPVILTDLHESPLPGQDPLTCLELALWGKRLLVLDSCERCLDTVAPMVKELLDHCSGLAVLVTSTEAVRVPGERVLVLDPLDVPDEGADGSSAEAVRLLYQRAVAGGADLDLADSVDELSRIARRLDGMPLALELAASRVVELGLTEVLSALDDRFSLLTNGFRTALPRHRTLEALVSWTVERLTSDELEVFRRLSCLEGRWPRSHVLAAVGLSSDVSFVLQRLIDCSLVQVDDQDDDRIRLLTTLRDFGRRAVPAETRASVRDNTCWALMDRLQPFKMGQYVDLSRELDLLAPDVRAVLANPSPASEIPLVEILTSCVHWFEHRGLFREGSDSCRRVAAVASQTRLKATALALAAGLLAGSGQMGEAAEIATEALSQRDIKGDAMAQAYVVLSFLHRELEDGRDPLDIAQEHVSDPNGAVGLSVRNRIATRKLREGDNLGSLEDLDALESQCRSRRYVGMLANLLVTKGGCLARLGRFDEAMEALAESGEIAEEYGFKTVVGSALSTMAIVALQTGDLQRAVDLAEQRLAIAKRYGDLQGEGAALQVIATAAPGLGQPALARSAAERSVDLYERMNMFDGVITSLFNLVVIDSGTEIATAAAGAERAVRTALAHHNAAFQLVALAAAGGICCLQGRPVGRTLLTVMQRVASGPPAIMTVLDPSDHAWLTTCLEAAPEGGGDGHELDLVAALHLGLETLRN